MQKRTIRLAGEQGKLVITATQMLESMISSPLPTRAEAADVFNAIVDGTSAVMLSAQTSIGSYPVHAVSTMAAIALSAEEQDIYSEPLLQRPTADEAVMHAAVALARDNAVALVVPSSTGGTVRACARYRPHRPIYALCDCERVARQLTLEWGVQPSLFTHPPRAQKLLKHAVRHVSKRYGLAEGDPVVITAGPRIGSSGATNLITLRFAGSRPAESPPRGAPASARLLLVDQTGSRALARPASFSGSSRQLVAGSALPVHPVVQHHERKAENPERVLRAQFAVLHVRVELFGEALHGGRRQLPRLSVDVRQVVAGVFQLAAAGQDQPAARPRPRRERRGKTGLGKREADADEPRCPSRYVV